MTLQTREIPQSHRLARPTNGPVLEKIHDGVADYNTTFTLINRYTPSNPYKALGFRAGQWFETTEDIYSYFLGVLPPLHMTGGGFVVGECTMAGLYESFLEIDGKYYCAVIDWTGSQSFADLWTALLKTLFDASSNARTKVALT